MNLDQDFCGVEFKLISVTLNNEYQCKDCAVKGKICDNKKELMIKPMPNIIRFTEVILQLTNTNAFIYDLYPYGFNLIDNNGYMYESKGLQCWDRLFTGKRFDHYLKLLPNGKVKTALVFPELATGVMPEKLSYRSYAYLDPSTAYDGYILMSLDSGKVLDVNASNNIIQNRKRKIQEEKAENEKQYQEHLQEIENRNKAFQIKQNNQQISYITSQLNDLKLLTFKRFNNILTYNEAIVIDNKIKNKEFKLRQIFEGNENHRHYLLTLDKEIQEYDKKLIEEKIHFSTVKYEPDDDFTPRDFEIYVQNMFKSIGYTTKLTPYVGDGGIDIVLENNGLTYGVQCKYFREDLVVGSQAIQQFMGALKNINAIGGFFVATCQFSRNAKAMAKKNNIRLIILPRKLT